MESIQSQRISEYFNYRVCSVGSYIVCAAVPCKQPIAERKFCIPITVQTRHHKAQPFSWVICSKVLGLSNEVLKVFAGVVCGNNSDKELRS
jgi:hypothetical protein